MNKVTYISKVLAILLITSILLIPGCKDKSSTESNSNTTTSSTESSPGIPAGRRQLDNLINLLEFPDGNDVAATVNGVEIKEAQIQEIIKPEIDRAKESLSNTQSLPEEVIISQFMKDIRENALTALIKEELLKEQVKDVNIVISNEEADEFFKKRLKQENVELEKFLKVLEASDIDYQDILDDAKKELTYVKYIVSKMDESDKGTEEDARKLYDENLASFTEPEQIRASHILIRASIDDSNDIKQKAKEKIDDLLRQVKEGADFAELAKANSEDDYSATKGGDLDYFDKRTMVPEFSQAAFALEPNNVSDVVQTDFGYHIIKVTDHKDEKIISFDEIKDNLIKSINNQKENIFIQKYIDSLIKDADIKFPEGKEIEFQSSELE